jgi:glycosyltransferase involved in cell wall biosynthesis
MRIAFVADLTVPHVAELSKALAHNGHDVTVYTRQTGRGAPREEQAASGCRVVRVPAGTEPPDDPARHVGPFARFLQDRWREDTPDVVHAHAWLAGVAAVPAARAAGVPVVETFQVLGVVERRYDAVPAQRIGTERMLGREADRIAATSSDEVVELVRMGVPRPKISMVPCGVDTDVFVPEGERLPRDRFAHRLVSVGDMVPRNGFATTIAALRALPDTELVIACAADTSRDEHARFLRSYAESMGVAEQVRLVGDVADDELPPLLRSADVVVCAPWYEPFGTVPLEAMACGVPVVASAVGGPRDVVVDGVTGKLVPPRKPRALAGMLRFLLGHRSVGEQFGAAGRDRAAARYSWDRVAKETVRAYERCTTSGVVV